MKYLKGQRLFPAVELELPPQKRPYKRPPTKCVSCGTTLCRRAIVGSKYEACGRQYYRFTLVCGLVACDNKASQGEGAALLPPGMASEVEPRPHQSDKAGSPRSKKPAAKSSTKSE